MRRLARLVCWVLLCFVLAEGGAAAGTAVGARVALFAVPSMNVCDRTPAVRDTIVAAVAGIDDCQDVTEAHLSGNRKVSHPETHGASRLLGLETSTV